METLHFSDNLNRLRRDHKLTQEQLAEYLGVTKASVSKWENRQSLPDLLLLPRLAAFFNVTIDDLLGYEPQLSTEEIQRLFRELTRDFAEQPFEAVMTRTKGLVKRYYSCYPFLLQICVLWLNHFMMAASKERHLEILQDIYELCTHIVDNCKDVGLNGDAVVFRSMISLQLGRAQEVIATLEEMRNPLRLSCSSDSLLIQAYQTTGQTDKANSFTQLCMFFHLTAILSTGIQYLQLHIDHLEVCEQTVHRLQGLVDLYQLERLNPNAAAQFYYQMAVTHSVHQQPDSALSDLEAFTRCVLQVLSDKFLLHGDGYFDAVQTCFDQLDTGSAAPRDKRLILETALQSLDHPAFLPLKEDNRYKKIHQTLILQGERL